jgi:hypothetical protein
MLHGLGHEPAAALGFTAAQDFEGDQFTFFKFPLEDLQLLFGLRVQELSIFDSIESHALEQVGRGRMAIVEVDGFFLPDTRGTSYRLEHTKTSIGINRLDPAARSMDYFHNAGFHRLSGEDYDCVLGKSPSLAEGADVLFPYVEFIKFDCGSHLPDLRESALALLRKHIAERPRDNPIAAFRSAITAHAQVVARNPPAFFHKYAFNTLRQLGANFELLASHLRWLAELGETGLDASRDSCLAISAGAKTFQFQLARAVSRKRFDGLETLLDPLVDQYERALDPLAALYLSVG